MGDLFKDKGEFRPDKLIASNILPIFSEGITLAANQGVLKRGTLIGALNGKGYLTGSTIDTTAVGVTGVLTDDVDTGTDVAGVIATVYLTGVFNPAALVLHASATLDTYKLEMRKLGMFTKEVQTY